MLTTKHRRLRKLIVAVVMSAALLVSFLLVFEGTKEQQVISRKFPPVTQCKYFYDSFKEDLLAFSIADWKRNVNLAESGLRVKYAGYL
jgi:hypothetical protein